MLACQKKTEVGSIKPPVSLNNSLAIMGGFEYWQNWDYSLPRIGKKVKNNVESITYIVMVGNGSPIRVIKGTDK